MPIIIELILIFFKIGLFSFGGGYAVISFLQHEAVSRGWMTAVEFTDIVAISQVTPGPIAVNLATFVGFREAGLTGSLAATFGVALPSFILVMLAIKFISKFKESSLLKNTFYGLRPTVAGLICTAAINIAWPEFFRDAALMDFTAAVSSVEFRAIAICTVVLILVYKFKISPFIMILLSAIAGILLF